VDGGGVVLRISPVAGLVRNGLLRTRVRARLLRESNMNQTWNGVEDGMHWTYRVLRRIAYASAAIVFWAWVIFLALAGKV
jgi:hypothetical protein